jgi:hypothetical protein
MDFWMKCAWALAALAAVVALVVLGSSPGGRPATPPAARSTPDYFTVQDQNRSVVEYGVRENGRAIIYSSRIAQ